LIQRPRPPCFVLALLALSAGCSSPFPPYSYVHSLSVLAIQAEPPEIAPGESADLRALVVDPAGRAVTLEWAYCTEAPAIGTGTDVNPDCITHESAPYLVPLGQGDTATVTMPMVQPTDLGLPDATDGFYLPVRMIARAGADQVTAIYRLRYALGGPRNTNPSIADLLSGVAADGTGGVQLADGAQLQSGDTVAIRAAYGPGSAEQYPVIDPSTMMVQMRTELLPTSWFIDAGKVDQETTGPERPVTNWALTERLPDALPAPLHVWAVVRDDRGGTAFTARALTLE
jgi:hypothetical protein